MQIYGSIVSVVPLVPVKKNALKVINEALKMKDGDVLYDLGSGDGRVLEYVLKENPAIKTVGVEIAPWPRLLSKIKLRKYSSRVKILNQDFFKTDLTNATHIYVYLYPAVLEKLEPLFDKTLSPGTRIVSCDFKFKNKTPIKIVEVPENKSLSKNFYIYEW
jgi:16S rRNA A1518/A1519 N6-dimethyltransferase RsmA/KsgA/DIM1 with predicted DNA glycosylase/AP lyase activity